MTFSMDRATYDALPEWKLRALRWVMGGDTLILGTPGTALAEDGTELAVFSDDRFTADGALALRLVLAGIGALPDDVSGQTPEEVLSAAGTLPGAAGFLADWLPDAVAYAQGDRVLYDSAVWLCLQAHTSQADWSPSSATASLWSHPGPAGGGVTEWATNTPYAVGDHVTYQGTEYVCLQAHTSQAGWTPPVVPALWQVVP